MGSDLMVSINQRVKVALLEEVFSKQWANPLLPEIRVRGNEQHDEYGEVSEEIVGVETDGEHFQTLWELCDNAYDKPKDGVPGVVKVYNRSVDISEVFEEEDEQLGPGHEGDDFLDVVAALLLPVFHDVSVWVVHYHRVNSSHVDYSHAQICSII